MHVSHSAPRTTHLLAISCWHNVAMVKCQFLFLFVTSATLWKHANRIHLRLEIGETVLIHFNWGGGGTLLL